MDKIKNMFRWIWNECKDIHTLLIFICVIIVVYSPVWGGFLLHFLFKWKWCLAVSTACFTFWAGPFTPFFPICMGITLSIKKFMQRRKSSETKPKPTKQIHNGITYDKLFWLFMIGSILGVITEGLFCLIQKGHWESHVVSVFGAFNILYGFGAVLFYVAATVLKRQTLFSKTVILMLSATFLELICGLLLKYALGMRAWNYQDIILNYKGLICVPFAIIWGLAGLAFCIFYPHINSFLDKFAKKIPHFACVICSLFMVFNLSLTGLSIIRWSERHYNVASSSALQTYLDEETPDSWMSNRFIEWKFLDETAS